MEEPTLDQFGLSEADYARWDRFENQVLPRTVGYLLGLSALGGAALGVVVGGVSLVTPVAVFMFGVMGASYALLPALILVSAWRPVAGWIIPRARLYRRFVQAQDAYRVWELRTRLDYWRSMSGRAFERELGAAFSRDGFGVEVTSASGDQGIDIVLTRDGRKTIVQCKATAKPVGPAVARELFGALQACGADDAILATTSDVTKGVREFIAGKPITVMTLADIVLMSRGRPAAAGPSNLGA